MRTYHLPFNPDLGPLLVDLVTAVHHKLAVPELQIPTDLDFSKGATPASATTGSLIDEPQDIFFRSLLPQMSFDPLDALELRSLNENSLRVMKTGRLETVLEGLDDALENKEILIPAGQVWDWLSGLNDLRIYLAALMAQANGSQELQELDWERLEAQVDAVFGRGADAETCGKQVEEGLVALLYLTVSWWQESLLAQVNSQEESS